MMWISKLIIPALIFSLIIGYMLNKIYNSYLGFLIIPLLTVIPILLIKLFRKTSNRLLYEIIGQYIFYLLHIYLILSVIFIIFLIFKIFSIDLLAEISKRKVLFHWIILLIIISLGIYGNFNFKDIVVKRYNISNNKIEQNLKLAFISDIHLSGEKIEKNLRDSFKKLKNEDVELLIIGGDLIDRGNFKVIKDDIKTILEEFEFKHGIYMILGNHEYYGDIEEVVTYIENLGIKILRDESLEIEGITLVGRDDYSNSQRKSLEELLDEVRKETFTIVLDHAPLLEELKKEKEIDLYLAGHTHGGQLFPLNLLVDKAFENSKGYKKIENVDTYVSSGIGTFYMMPYRIGSESEILIFTLERGEIK